MILERKEKTSSTRIPKADIREADFVYGNGGEMEITENNYTLAWLQPSPDESAHLQPCFSPSPSEIFIMQRRGLEACSVLYSRAETMGELEKKKKKLIRCCIASV